MTLFLVGVVKGGVILALGLAATALLEKQSAAVRHWLLAAVLACAAAMPLLQFVVPTWFPMATSPIAGIAAQPSAPIARGSQSPAGPRASIAAAAVTITPRVASLAQPVWTVGVIVSVALLAIGFLRLARIAERSQRVNHGRWRELADQIARELEVARPLVLQSDHPALLVTWGARPPRVILPVSAPHWSDERIRIVLRHELAHTRRGDWVVQMAAEIVRCVYWFNPLVWIACARLRQLSEEACDNAVLRHGTEGPEYAQHLLELARMFTRHRTFLSAAPAIARPSGLERRVTAMLNPRINRSPITPSLRALTAAALTAITIPIAGFAVFAQDAPARFSGTVYDPSGAPLSEVTVSLTNRDTSATRAAPSNQAGYFDLSDLRPGAYRLEVKGLAFKDVTEDLTFPPGSTVRRDFRMNLGSVEETITVTGEPASRPSGPRAAPDLNTFMERFRGKRVQPPVKLKDVRPTYAQELRDAGVEGTVFMEGRIAADGSMAGLHVLTSAHAELSRSAIDAVNQWQFEPTRLWGTPVDVDINVKVTFRKNQ